MSALDPIEVAVLWRAAERSDEWERRGYVPLCSPHHFRDFIPSDRAARRVLNGLVGRRLLEHARHGRYRCWRLPRDWRRSDDSLD